VAEAVHSGVLCLLALSMSCASPTDAAFASEAQQQVKVDRPQGAEAGHHPLIEVKFVLRQAPAERDQTPRIELTESLSVAGSVQMGSMQTWGSHVLSLNPGYVNPNADICSGWACRGYLVNASATQGSRGK
jgi:hypothetical protein